MKVWAGNLGIVRIAMSWAIEVEPSQHHDLAGSVLVGDLGNINTNATDVAQEAFRSVFGCQRYGKQAHGGVQVFLVIGADIFHPEQLVSFSLG